MHRNDVLIYYVYSLKNIQTFFYIFLYNYNLLSNCFNLFIYDKITPAKVKSTIVTHNIDKKDIVLD